MRKILGMMFLATTVLIAVEPPSLRADDDKYARRSLNGISAVGVNIEDLPDGAKVLGLTKEIVQNDIELKLRLSGMHVVTVEESAKLPGRPFLNVVVSLTDDALVSDIDVELRQNAKLDRNGDFAPSVPTWSVGVLMLNPSLDRTRDRIKDLIDQFLNAWLSVNPKK